MHTPFYIFLRWPFCAGRSPLPASTCICLFICGRGCNHGKFCVSVHISVCICVQTCGTHVYPFVYKHAIVYKHVYTCMYTWSLLVSLPFLHFVYRVCSVKGIATGFTAFYRKMSIQPRYFTRTMSTQLLIATPPPKARISKGDPSVHSTRMWGISYRSWSVLFSFPNTHTPVYLVSNKCGPWPIGGWDQEPTHTRPTGGIRVCTLMFMYTNCCQLCTSMLYTIV